jgi:hypothetical protein
VGDVVGSPQFVARDATAAPLAARLANFMPGLVRKGRKVFGGPSGINWIDATDHFVCRNSHRVKFSRFSEFQHDDRVERTLQAMAHQTVCSSALTCLCVSCDCQFANAHTCHSLRLLTLLGDLGNGTKVHRYWLL